jgi:hypothetical protein
MVDLATLGKSTGKSNNHQEVQVLTDFKEAVRVAEKSTLLFNLNLGKVPLVNKDTMSTKVTKALTELAAKEEKSKSSVPSADTMASIDDLLSVVQDMQFYGKTTKSFQRLNDPLNGSYCTVPVKYVFSDKETRTYAETVLRDKCKVQCTTPYPTILRESIKQVINGVKAEYPNYFVKVNVDTGKMVLRVSMRPLVEKGSKEEKTWYTLDNPVPIPKEALDISARKVPDGFKVTHCYKNSKSRPPVENEVVMLETPSLTQSQASVADTPPSQSQSQPATGNSPAKK